MSKNFDALCQKKAKPRFCWDPQSLGLGGRANPPPGVQLKKLATLAAPNSQRFVQVFAGTKGIVLWKSSGNTKDKYSDIELWSGPGQLLAVSHLQLASPPPSMSQKKCGQEFTRLSRLHMKALCTSGTILCDSPHVLRCDAAAGHPPSPHRPGIGNATAEPPGVASRATAPVWGPPASALATTAVQAGPRCGDGDSPLRIGIGPAAHYKIGMASAAHSKLGIDPL